MDKSANLIWIDLEMTGLLPESDTIIEIATIVTNPHLEIIAEGPNLAIHKSDELLDGMDEWNTEHHTNSGLVKKVKESLISTRDAEIQTLNFLNQYVDPGMSPMCGNTICQDRRFLYNEMPELEKFFHYRHIDVSTIKELVKRWKPDSILKRTSEPKHLALEDIKDSIEELKYYRSVFINV